MLNNLFTLTSPFRMNVWEVYILIRLLIQLSATMVLSRVTFCVCVCVYLYVSQTWTNKMQLNLGFYWTRRRETCTELLNKTKFPRCRHLFSSFIPNWIFFGLCTSCQCTKLYRIFHFSAFFLFRNNQIIHSTWDAPIFLLQCSDTSKIYSRWFFIRFACDNAYIRFGSFLGYRGLCSQQQSFANSWNETLSGE